MANLKDLQEAGHSVTHRAWFTNPLRRALLIASRPYFAWVIAELERTRLSDEERDARRHSELEAARQASASQAHQGLSQIVGTLKDELRDIVQNYDALRKDQMAVNYRLGSMEDLLDERKEAEATDKVDVLGRIEALALAVEQATEVPEPTSHAASGFMTLQPNQPMAILGTSLVLHDGQYGRLVLRQPDLISDYILAGGFWDSHLKPVIERYGAANRSAIDAGAYLGFHSCYMARYFQTVYAFEPQVEIYRMLCTNLLLNNCRNVVATNGALYDQAGYMRLADSVKQEIPVPSHDGDIDYDRIGNAAAMAFQVTDASSRSAIPTQTVDQLGLTNLGFMKVDTQGSDLRVLRGARATIERCRPVIVAEYERELSKNHDWNLDDFHSFFGQIGYNVEVLREQSEGKQIDLLATPV